MWSSPLWSWFLGGAAPIYPELNLENLRTGKNSDREEVYMSPLDIITNRWSEPIVLKPLKVDVSKHIPRKGHEPRKPFQTQNGFREFVETGWFLHTRFTWGKQELTLVTIFWRIPFLREIVQWVFVEVPAEVLRNSIHSNKIPEPEVVGSSQFKQYESNWITSPSGVENDFR